MLVCQRNADLQPNIEADQEVDWTRAAQAYTNIEEMPSFISRQRQSAAQCAFTTLSDSKGNNSKHTPLCSNTWKLKHHYHSR